MDWFLLALISALLSAAAAITQKNVLFKMEALEFSFLLSVFNLVFSIPILLFVNYSTLSIIALLVLYGKTILGSFAFLNVMFALKNLEISGSLPLMVLTPGLVALFSFIFLGEMLTGFEVLGIVTLLIGTYILEFHHKENLLSPFKYLLKSENHKYIIIALLLFSTTAVLDKYLLKEFKMAPNSFVFFQHLFLCSNFFLMVLFSKSIKIKQVKKILAKSNIKWFVLISIFTIGYRYTQIEAVKVAPVALVLTVKRFSVFFATLIGGKLFSENYLQRKIVATLILIAGAILIINW